MPETIELGEVPFYWRSKATPSQPPLDIPPRLPFSFEFDERLQLVTQRRDPVVLHWLHRVYTEDANVGYLQQGHALADSYGGEFIEFFGRASAQLMRMPESAADIGCGGVYLLSKLRERGLRVKGLDPSPVTRAAGHAVGIEIVPEFYPSPKFTERFDALLHYDVLEHVVDPVSFLASHHANLNEGGGVIFAVPDCSDQVAEGDLAMIIHEHLNYFDLESLERTVRAAGFVPMLLERSRHGGVLLCCAVVEPERAGPPVAAAGGEKFSRFQGHVTIARERFATMARRVAGGEIGFYVPLRAFPYLNLVPTSTRVRLFDDDPGLRGRYFDGFDVAVEGADSLLASPPTLTAICSRAFGARIAGRLEERGLPRSRIVLWEELFAKAGA